jgi:hypothetical protein
MNGKISMPTSTNSASAPVDSPYVKIASDLLTVLGGLAAIRADHDERALIPHLAPWYQDANDYIQDDNRDAVDRLRLEIIATQELVHGLLNLIADNIKGSLSSYELSKWRSVDSGRVDADRAADASPPPVRANSAADDTVNEEFLEWFNGSGFGQ